MSDVVKVTLNVGKILTVLTIAGVVFHVGRIVLLIPHRIEQLELQVQTFGDQQRKDHELLTRIDERTARQDRNRPNFGSVRTPETYE